ncbi:MAG: hypothetical protein QNJ23_11985 [Woeseiaceae bacterium]|nr:hypothetical protein [Woeseiaceae bacterium]
MSGRQSLLAEIEARRRAQATKDMTDQFDVLAADLTLVPDDNSYDPYDKPGPAKPLDVDRGATVRRKVLQRKKRRR